MAAEEIKAFGEQLTKLQSAIDSIGSSVSLSLILSGTAIALFVVAIISIVALSRKITQTESKNKDGIREYFAIGIVIVGICIVGLLGLVGMVTGDENFRREAMAGVLPLIGAWVGAVIAYYFGKENFQAASDSQAKFLSREERLAATPVSKVMMPIAQVKGIIRVNDIQEAKQKEIKALADSMQYNRAPVLTNSMAPLLIIHRSALYEYLAKDASNRGNKLENIHTDSNDLW